MIILKIGGSVVDGLHQSTIDDIKTIAQKERLVIVHGGGKEVTSISQKLGKEQKFVVSPGGIKSRYTDRETSEIFTMVMAGKINKNIVRMLLEKGIKAVGISGIDSSTIEAERKKKLIIVNEKGRKMVIDGGYTGKISSVNPSLINILLDNGYVPVISPIALSSEFEFLNVDGDRAAAHVAGSLQSEKVIFLTNVNGLIMNNEIVNELTNEEAKSILPKIGFGMEKKVMACTEALDQGVREAIIASGQIQNPVSCAVRHENCTVISAK